MSNYKQRFDEWKQKSLGLISDNMSYVSGQWLLSESKKWMEELDDVERQLKEPELAFDKREDLDKKAIEIVNILLELSKRMEKDQSRLHDEGIQCINLLAELDEIDDLRNKEE